VNLGLVCGLMRRTDFSSRNELPHFWHVHEPSALRVAMPLQFPQDFTGPTNAEGGQPVSTAYAMRPFDTATAPRAVTTLLPPSTYCAGQPWTISTFGAWCGVRSTPFCWPPKNALHGPRHLAPCDDRNTPPPQCGHTSPFVRTTVATCSAGFVVFTFVPLFRMSILLRYSPP
jgi:hypothetical protein